MQIRIRIVWQGSSRFLTSCLCNLVSRFNFNCNINISTVQSSCSCLSLAFFESREHNNHIKIIIEDLFCDCYIYVYPLVFFQINMNRFSNYYCFFPINREIHCLKFQNSSHNIFFTFEAAQQQAVKLAHKYYIFSFLKHFKLTYLFYFELTQL